MVERARSPSRQIHGEYASPAGRVRMGPLMELPQVIRDLGHDPRSALAGQGLSADDFRDPDAEISFVRAGKLLARCVSETGCSHLGLLVGERTLPSALGMPGYLLHTAFDVRAALLDLVRHISLHDSGGVVTLDTTKGMTRFGYAIYLIDVEAADQIYDLSMAIACNIMRSLCGADWRPSEVRLARSVPRDVMPYTRFFQAPIHFDADHSAVVFPSRWLDHRVASSNPELHRHLEKEAQRLQAGQATDLAGQLRGLLRGSLALGKIDAAHIARQLGLHERTLNRRLRQSGTNFRRELQAVRYTVAQELLANTRLPLSRIAAALNYSDTSAFVRAFKQWSGMPPTAWRRRHGQS